MKCPVCNKNMIVVEYDKIELDYCTNCTGIWFDANELALLLESVHADIDAGEIHYPNNTADKPSTEKKRKCPTCGKKMTKTRLKSVPPVLVDECPIGDGIWFDGGEINQFLKQLQTREKPTGKEETILSFIQDVFQPHAQNTR